MLLMERPLHNIAHPTVDNQQMEKTCLKSNTTTPHLIANFPDLNGQLELSRKIAIDHINLIYDALAILNKSSGSIERGAVRSSKNPTTASCHSIDLVVRDALTDALDETCWLASVCEGGPEGLLNIQAKLLLELLDTSDDTPIAALAHSIASAISADPIARGKSAIGLAGKSS